MAKSIPGWAACVAVLALSVSVTARAAQDSAPQDPLGAFIERAQVAADSGIWFACPADRHASVHSALRDYFKQLQISASWLKSYDDPAAGTFGYRLNTPVTDTDTLSLERRKHYGIKPSWMDLPARDGRFRRVRVVSEKEIVLALLQNGRRTEFAGPACDIEALKEHVGLRRNIAAWAEKLYWNWPDGGPATWNTQYWDRGTPRPGVDVSVAMQDAFAYQKKYAIGCYTATKMVVAQGVLDYYGRVRKDPKKLELAKARLWLDQDPLVDIEPPRIWSFEDDFDPRQMTREGKLLALKTGVAARNFVPGDWVYLRNTDEATRHKVGYEGSNAIYLGRDRLDDYYNDNNNSYRYERKLDEVYQWRNGVFSRSRDFRKLEKLSPEQRRALSKTPEQGGLVMDVRLVPFLFGFEELPAFTPAPPPQPGAN